MKKQETAVEQIDFNKLRRDLQTLMEEVDRRLASEFDAFSPTMWKRLQRTVDGVILEISAVRLALNGYTTAEVARKLGLKKQQVAAFLAYNTMWQSDYASPELIIGTVDCPVCGSRHRQPLRDDVGERCPCPRVPPPAVPGRGERAGAEHEADSQGASGGGRAWSLATSIGQITHGTRGSGAATFLPSATTATPTSS